MRLLKKKKLKLKQAKINNNKEKLCSCCDGFGVLQNKSKIERCFTCYGNGKIRICEKCDKITLHPFSTLCKECSEKERKEKLLKEEQIKFEKAKKLSFENDNEKLKEFKYFFCEQYPYNDGFFETFEQFFEVMYDRGFSQENLPKYVWGTYEKNIWIDIDWALENASDDLHDSALATISEEDYKKLKEFVENWCKNQTGTITYYPDYNFAIEVPNEAGDINE